MVKALERAVAEIARLPEAEQEKIANELLVHLEKLRALRSDIEAGLRSLDAGQGRELDLQDFISRSREKNAKG